MKGNTVKRVKKLDEGQTMVCYVCHKEGHKSYKCKVKNGGGAKKKEKNKNETIKKDASTCNNLCVLDSPFCDQVCFDKVVVETYT